MGRGKVSISKEKQMSNKQIPQPADPEPLDSTLDALERALKGLNWLFSRVTNNDDPTWEAFCSVQ